MPGKPWREFLALLVGVTKDHAIANWLVPWSVLDAEGLVFLAVRVQMV